MPHYRRNRVPGGTFFFTVNLLDRRTDLLVTQIDALRDAVRQVRVRAPFHTSGSETETGGKCAAPSTHYRSGLQPVGLRGDRGGSRRRFEAECAAPRLRGG